MNNDDMFRNEDTFPAPGPTLEGDTFRTRYGVLYVCTAIEGLGWGWKQISEGPHIPDPEVFGDDLAE